jgi:hypothetical protein
MAYPQELYFWLFISRICSPYWNTVQYFSSITEHSFDSLVSHAFYATSLQRARPLLWQFYNFYFVGQAVPHVVGSHCRTDLLICDVTDADGAAAALTSSFPWDRCGLSILLLPFAPKEQEDRSYKMGACRQYLFTEIREFRVEVEYGCCGQCGRDENLVQGLTALAWTGR